MDVHMCGCIHGLLSIFLILGPVLNASIGGEEDIPLMSILLRGPMLLVSFGSSTISMEQVCLVSCSQDVSKEKL